MDLSVCGLVFRVQKSEMSWIFCVKNVQVNQKHHLASAFDYDMTLNHGWKPWEVAFRLILVFDNQFAELWRVLQWTGGRVSGAAVVGGLVRQTYIIICGTLGGTGLKLFRSESGAEKPPDQTNAADRRPYGPLSVGQRGPKDQGQSLIFRLSLWCYYQRRRKRGHLFPITIILFEYRWFYEDSGKKKKPARDNQSGQDSSKLCEWVEILQACFGNMA